MKHGMMLTREITAKGGNISVNGGYDPLAIRLAALYLDSICIPQSQMMGFGLSPELEALKREGFVFEKTYPFANGVFNMDSVLIKAYSDCFSDLNKTHNETWIVHHSLNAKLLKQKKTDDGGECIQLLNALPLPDENFPIGDLLEFKLKRGDNLKELLLTIEEERLKIIESENTDMAIKRGVLEIEKRLIALNKLIKETKRGWYLTSFAIDINSTNMLDVFTAVYGEARNIGMDELSALMSSMGASFASSLNVKFGYRFKAGKPDSPYLYAAEVKSKFKIC